MAGGSDELYDRVVALPDPNSTVVRRFCMLRCREEAVSFVRAVTTAGAAGLFDGTLGEAGAVALSGAGPCAVARCATGEPTGDPAITWSSLGTLVGEANNLVNANKLTEAIKLVNKVLRAVPDMAQAYAARGTAYAIGNDLRKAERDFRRASRFSPRSADFCKRLGQVLVAVGKQEEGSTAYEEADRLAGMESAARLRAAKLIERSLQGEVSEEDLRVMLEGCGSSDSQQGDDDECDGADGGGADSGRRGAGESSGSAGLGLGSVDVARERAVVLAQAGDLLAARALLEDALAFAAVPVLLRPEPSEPGDASATASGFEHKQAGGEDAPMELELCFMSALPYTPRAAMLPDRLLGHRQPLVSVAGLEPTVRSLALRLPWLKDEARRTNTSPEALWRLWSQLGLVNARLGLTWDAVRAYEAAIALLEALVSSLQGAESPAAAVRGSTAADDLVALRVRYAHDLRALGLFRGSLAQLSGVLWDRPSSAEAWHTRGMTLHSMGRHRAAVQALALGVVVASLRGLVVSRVGALASMKRSGGVREETLPTLGTITAGIPEWLYEPGDVHGDGGLIARRKLSEELGGERRGCAFLLATSFHSLGCFGSAFSLYSALFEEQPSEFLDKTGARRVVNDAGADMKPEDQGNDHLGFCQRDWMLAVCRWLPYPRRSVSLDAWTEPALKESFAKRAGRAAVVEGYPMLHLEAEDAVTNDAVLLADHSLKLDESVTAACVSPAITLSELPVAWPPSNISRLRLPLLPVDEEDIQRLEQRPEAAADRLVDAFTSLAERHGVELKPGALQAAVAASRGDGEEQSSPAAEAAAEAEAGAPASSDAARTERLRRDEATRSALPAELVHMADTADRVGAMMQYSEPAFVASWRQHRQCGLAALETAQLSRRHWEAMADGAEAGAEVLEAHSLLVPDSSCSKPSAGTDALGTLDAFYPRIQAAQRAQGCSPVRAESELRGNAAAGAFLDMVEVGVESASALSDDGVFAIMSRGAATSITTPSGTKVVDWQLSGAADPASSRLAWSRSRELVKRQAGTGSGSGSSQGKSSKASGKRRTGKGGSGGKARGKDKARPAASGAAGAAPSGGGVVAALAAGRASKPSLGEIGREACSAWPTGYHGMCWRDLFDVSVQWRQLSEGFDPVFWLDQLTSKAFSEGFGLQTPLVQGQCHNPRYFAYFSRALELTKSLLLQQELHTDEEREQIRAARSMRNLTKASADRDFFVVSSCFSHARPPLHPRHRMPAMRAGRSGRVVEGTRLTALSPGMPQEAGAAMRSGCRARQAAVARALEVTPGGPGPLTAPQREAVRGSDRLVQDFGDCGDVATGDGSDLDGAVAASSPGGSGRPPASFDEALDALEAASPGVAPAAIGSCSRALQQRVAKDFTIRTPSTPQRWAAFEEELALLWLQLSRAMSARIMASRLADPDARKSALDAAPDATFIASTILRMFFFWANMGALTRGSAACALSALLGLSAASGLSPALPLRGRYSRAQLDWEAILTEDAEVFVARMGPAVFPGLAWADLTGTEKHPFTGTARWRIPVHDDDDVRRELQPTARRSAAPQAPTAGASARNPESRPAWLARPGDDAGRADEASPWFSTVMRLPPSACSIASGFDCGAMDLHLHLLPSIGLMAPKLEDAFVALGVPNLAEREAVEPSMGPVLPPSSSSFLPEGLTDFTAAYFARDKRVYCSAQPDEARDLASLGCAPGALPAAAPPLVADAPLMDAEQHEEAKEENLPGAGVEAVLERKRRRLQARARLLGRLPVDATKHRILDTLAPASAVAGAASSDAAVHTTGAGDVEATAQPVASSQPTGGTSDPSQAAPEPASRAAAPMMDVELD
jgi:tetratricopeptide (TPR) repeat protein